LLGAGRANPYREHKAKKQERFHHVEKARGLEQTSGWRDHVFSAAGCALAISYGLFPKDNSRLFGGGDPNRPALKQGAANNPRGAGFSL
jgi:hypothetical protein